MSEKKRQKKEGRDKNKKNQAMRKSMARRPKKNARAIAVEPSPLPGTDIKPKPGVRGIV